MKLETLGNEAKGKGIRKTVMERNNMSKVKKAINGYLFKVPMEEMMKVRDDMDIKMLSVDKLVIFILIIAFFSFLISKLLNHIYDGSGFISYILFFYLFSRYIVECFKEEVDIQRYKVIKKYIEIKEITKEDYINVLINNKLNFWNYCYLKSLAEENGTKQSTSKSKIYLEKVKNDINQD